jgi:hypothetical protein
MRSRYRALGTGQCRSRPKSAVTVLFASGAHVSRRQINAVAALLLTMCGYSTNWIQKTKKNRY